MDFRRHDWRKCSADAVALVVVNALAAAAWDVGRFASAGAAWNVRHDRRLKVPLCARHARSLTPQLTNVHPPRASRRPRGLRHLQWHRRMADELAAWRRGAHLWRACTSLAARSHRARPWRASFAGCGSTALHLDRPFATSSTNVRDRFEEPTRSPAVSSSPARAHATLRAAAPLPRAGISRSRAHLHLPGL